MRDTQKKDASPRSSRLHSKCREMHRNLDFDKQALLEARRHSTISYSHNHMTSCISFSKPHRPLLCIVFFSPSDDDAFAILLSCPLLTKLCGQCGVNHPLVTLRCVPFIFETCPPEDLETGEDHRTRRPGNALNDFPNVRIGTIISFEKRMNLPFSESNFFSKHPLYEFCRIQSLQFRDEFIGIFSQSHELCFPRHITDTPCLG